MQPLELARFQTNILFTPYKNSCHTCKKIRLESPDSYIQPLGVEKLELKLLLPLNKTKL